MPKHVDHEARRTQIIETVWRLVGEEGLDAVTTRRIAEATGQSNGLLRYYFPSKDAVITAALHYVFNATNLRASQLPEQRGLAAVRSLAREILPLDDLRRTEARIAVAYWNRALQNENDLEFSSSLASWRSTFLQQMREAVADGEIPASTDLDSAVNELVTFLMGAQVTALFAPEIATPQHLDAQLEQMLRQIARA